MDGVVSKKKWYQQAGEPMRGGPEERCQELKELAEVPGWNTRPGLETGETEAELRLRHRVPCNHLKLAFPKADGKMLKIL